MDWDISNLIWLCILSMVTAFDPCLDPIDISDARRSVENNSTTEVYLCDAHRIVSGQWYSLQSSPGDRMAEGCVPYYHCGTMGTMYLDGEHPTVANPGPVDMPVAMSYHGNCHFWDDTIQVKLCANSSTPTSWSYVYKLKPPGGCEAAYCTENIRHEAATSESSVPETTTPRESSTSPRVSTQPPSPPVTEPADKTTSTTVSTPELLTTRETQNKASSTSTSPGLGATTDGIVVVNDADTQTEQEDGGQTTLIIGVLVSMIAALILVVAVCGVMWYRRRNTPKTDKSPSGPHSQKDSIGMENDGYLNYVMPGNDVTGDYQQIEENQYDEIKEGLNLNKGGATYQSLGKNDNHVDQHLYKTMENCDYLQPGGSTYQSLQEEGNPAVLHIYNTMAASGGVTSNPTTCKAPDSAETA